MVSGNTCNGYPGEWHLGRGWGKSPLRTEEKYQPLFGGKANWHLDGHRVCTKGGVVGEAGGPPLKPCEGPCSIPCKQSNAEGGRAAARPGDAEVSSSKDQGAAHLIRSPSRPPLAVLLLNEVPTAAHTRKPAPATCRNVPATLNCVPGSSQK